LRPYLVGRCDSDDSRKNHYHLRERQYRTVENGHHSRRGQQIALALVSTLWIIDRGHYHVLLAGIAKFLLFAGTKPLGCHARSYCCRALWYTIAKFWSRLTKARTASAGKHFIMARGTFDALRQRVGNRYNNLLENCVLTRGPRFAMFLWLAWRRPLSLAFRWPLQRGIRTGFLS